MDLRNNAKIGILCLLTFIVFLNVGFVDSATDLDEERLINDLLVGYPKHARPLRDRTWPITIQVGFYIIAIREFDEVNERFSVIGVVVLTWPDDRLMWNASDYNGIKTFLVDNNVFWTPPVYVQNSIDEFKKVGEESYWKVRYLDYGYGTIYPGNVFSTSCTPNVQKFPFDKQLCYLNFALIGYYPTEILMVEFPHLYVNPMQYYEGDGLWDITGTKSLVLENTVSLGFEMKRKPMLAIMNIILPIMLMSFLNIMVFLIPAESGERISFSLTVLLALAVFLTLVSDSMPKSATSIAYLSYYLAAILVNSILITLGTIVNLKFYHQNEDGKVPNCLQALTRCLLCKRRKKKQEPKYNDVGFDVRNGVIRTANGQLRNVKNGHNMNPISTGLQNERPSTNGHMKDYRPKIYIGIQNTGPNGWVEQDGASKSDKATVLTSARETDDTSGDDVITWQMVSVAFDVIFFVVALLLVFGFTVAYFIVVNI